LGDNFTSTNEEEDYITNLTLTKYVETVTADAYGIISTPDGTFQCLRLSIVSQKYTRPNESTAYTLISTTNQVSFMTKEGAFFNAQVSTPNGTATLSNFQYRKVVLTSSLSEPSDVKFNNDSKGVTINNDNSTAHPSAILDVKSDSLGILIPRIAKANRPNSPATGLLIYQIDNTPGFYYYNGTSWRILSSTASARIAAEEAVNEIISGKSQLENGSVLIEFDSPQDDFEKLLINIQLEGDCNGIYISRKTREGFEVKELQKGKSNVKFSWKIN
jgi:hypothetical protein